MRWHCPPNTGFEIRALAVWGRARYLSVTEAPHNTDFHTWMGKKHFCFFETAETGNRTPNSGVKGSGANHYPRAPALFYQMHSLARSCGWIWTSPVNFCTWDQSFVHKCILNSICLSSILLDDDLNKHLRWFKQAYMNRMVSFFSWFFVCLLCLAYVPHCRRVFC